MLVFARNLLDKIGIAATSLCAIHCILLPLLLPILPFLGVMFIADEAFERSLLLFTMVLGVVALYSGFQRYHRKIYPFYSLILGGFLYLNKGAFGEAIEPFVVVVGASFIVAAHVLNMKLCASCSTCQDHDHSEPHQH